MKRKTKWILIATATLMILALAWLLYPLTYGVWLPDIWTGQGRTLGTLTLTNGIKFTVKQGWNYSDFYTTMLFQENPDGTRYYDGLDYDDSATWSVPISADWSNKTVTVILGGNRPRCVRWECTNFLDRVYW